MWTNVTAVPNAVFDRYLKDLSCTELKVLLVVTRQTIGWEDKQGKRKKSDWISGSQFLQKTGSSKRAICSAIEALIQKGFIEVLDEHGNFLDLPEKRKGKQRLYFRLSCFIHPNVENKGTTGGQEGDIDLSNAKLAPDLSKKVNELKQKMHITK